ncbi:hypothetical protein JXA05_01740, partial [Candidatus Peregrinibacteria bacterium]|nr:hypothetical protein [Candidatus Peregrinibacteria bacterium]
KNMETPKAGQPETLNSEQQEQQKPDALGYSLKDVREKFGVLLAESANCVFHRDYHGHGDRILINTTAEGIRGPKTGKASELSPEGSAFIDMAITPEVAQHLYEQLGRAIKDWQES